MPDTLSVNVTHQDEIAIVAAAGEVDLATAPSLEASLLEAQAKGPVVLDLTGVGFMDSTGLRVLIAAHEAAVEHGTGLGVVVTEGPVTRLLEITGVDEHLNLYPSVDAACNG